MFPKLVMRIAFFMLLSIQIACSADRTYQGKVIDAETLKPIEGALVLTIWEGERFGGMLGSCKVLAARETLTDKDGEWSISGPSGNNSDIGYFFQYLGFYRTRDPRFGFFKPGYTRIEDYGNFFAYPYVDKDKNLEGIILYKPGSTGEERNEYYQKYRDTSPFVMINNPDRRLRELDFSFEYSGNVIRLGTAALLYHNIKPYYLYTVVGLRKVKDLEERKRSMNFAPGGGCDFSSRIRTPLSDKIQSEEQERLFGPRKRR